MSLPCSHLPSLSSFTPNNTLRRPSCCSESRGPLARRQLPQVRELERDCIVLSFSHIFFFNCSRSLSPLFNFYQKQRRRFRSRRLGHRPGLVPRAAEANPRADGGDEGKEGVSSSWPDEGRGEREREEENDDDDDDRRNKPRLSTPTPLSHSLSLSKKKKKTQKRNSRSPSRSPATPPPSRSSPPTSRPSSARPGSPTRPSSRPPWFPSGSRPRAATCARRSRR